MNYFYKSELKRKSELSNNKKVYKTMPYKINEATDIRQLPVDEHDCKRCKENDGNVQNKINIISYRLFI